MDNYEILGVIGEGTYGIVLRARHLPTNTIVAIKKFKDNDDDPNIQKTALREIKILKSLRHDNIVCLLDVFRKSNQLYLVFEYIDHTLLEELELQPHGITVDKCKNYLYQLITVLQFIHSKNIIHRDIKPENLLVTKSGILKLCDFGFARSNMQNSSNSVYTDYVATRWYRSPELLVGDIHYGDTVHGVDVWAAGCVFAEILTGQPLFPGDSDIDQLYQIIKTCGQLTTPLLQTFLRNELYIGVKLPQVKHIQSLTQRFPLFSNDIINILQCCLKYESSERYDCTQLLQHSYFDSYQQQYLHESGDAIQQDRIQREQLLHVNNVRRQAKHAAKQQSIDNTQQQHNTNNKPVRPDTRPQVLPQPVTLVTRGVSEDDSSIPGTCDDDDIDVEQCTTQSTSPISNSTMLKLSGAVDDRPLTQSRLTCYEQVLPAIINKPSPVQQYTVLQQMNNSAEYITHNKNILNNTNETNVVRVRENHRLSWDKLSLNEMNQTVKQSTQQYNKTSTQHTLPLLLNTNMMRRSYDTDENNNNNNHTEHNINTISFDNNNNAADHTTHKPRSRSTSPNTIPSQTRHNTVLNPVVNQRSAQQTTQSQSIKPHNSIESPSYTTPYTYRQTPYNTNNSNKSSYAPSYNHVQSKQSKSQSTAPYTTVYQSTQPSSYRTTYSQISQYGAKLMQSQQSTNETFTNTAKAKINAVKTTGFYSKQNNAINQRRF